MSVNLGYTCTKLHRKDAYIYLIIEFFLICCTALRCRRTEFGKCWLKVMMPGLVRQKHEDLCKSAPPAFHWRQAWERAAGIGVDPFLKVGKTACLNSESTDPNGNLIPRLISHREAREEWGHRERQVVDFKCEEYMCEYHTCRK